MCCACSAPRWWPPADAELGFPEWEPPDAGENANAEHFGAGNAGEGAGWDEVYTRRAERWLSRAEPAEPFCLIVSLVNPHDVLGYPAAYRRGGYAVHFTYDDHQAGTAMQDAPGQPNRIRAIRTREAKYAVYHDPRGRAAPEYELYDLRRDPLERENLVDVRSGVPTARASRPLRDELAERLIGAMRECRTSPVRAPAWLAPAVGP
jgi:hypothetical protein